MHVRGWEVPHGDEARCGWALACSASVLWAVRFELNHAHPHSQEEVEELKEEQQVDASGSSRDEGEGGHANTGDGDVERVVAA